MGIILEIVAQPQIDTVQYRFLPLSDLYNNDPACGARIVIIFSSHRQAATALHCARLLVTAVNSEVWVACPAAASLAGRLQFLRFVRFVGRSSNKLPPELMGRVRFLSCPCSPGSDPVEQFSGPRSIVLIRTPWWRHWQIPERRRTLTLSGRLAIVL